MYVIEWKIGGGAFDAAYVQFIVHVRIGQLTQQTFDFARRERGRLHLWVHLRKNAIELNCYSVRIIRCNLVMQMMLVLCSTGN